MLDCIPANYEPDLLNGIQLISGLSYFASPAMFLAVLGHRLPH